MNAYVVVMMAPAYFIMHTEQTNSGVLLSHASHPLFYSVSHKCPSMEETKDDESMNNTPLSVCSLSYGKIQVLLYQVPPPKLPEGAKISSS